MSALLRAYIELQPGSQLEYNCPRQGSSREAQRFFESHHGKLARFIGFATTAHGPLNYQGLEPGVYRDEKRIMVQFDGEEPCTLQTQHFIVRECGQQVLAQESKEENVGLLPHPILFYPDDLVRVKNGAKGLTHEPRLVSSVALDPPLAHEDGVPRYLVYRNKSEQEQENQRVKAAYQGNSILALLTPVPMPINLGADDLELLRRGNVWKLYHAPKTMSFSSLEEENVFWARSGISRLVSTDLTFQEAYLRFLNGESDFIVKDPHDTLDLYRTPVLHDRFREHRERVRALTKTLWEK